MSTKTYTFTKLNCLKSYRLLMTRKGLIRRKTKPTKRFIFSFLIGANIYLVFQFSFLSCLWVIIIIIIIIPCALVTSPISSGPTPESDWQQISSGLQDSSEYSGWSQQWYSLNGFHSSSDFLLFHSSCQSFEYRSKSPNYHWYHRHPRWFGYFCLMAYQLFLGYLMPKPFS